MNLLSSALCLRPWISRLNIRKYVFGNRIIIDKQNSLPIGCVKCQTVNIVRWNSNRNPSISVARILSAKGVHVFFVKKVHGLFQSSTSKDGLKLQNEPRPPHISAQQKMSQKLTLALSGGYTWCDEGASTHFSCRLRHFFYSALWSAGARTAPPGYAYKSE